MKIKLISVILAAMMICSCVSTTENVTAEIYQPTIPVLTLKENNPLLRLQLVRKDSADYKLEKVVISLDKTSDLSDIEALRLYIASPDGMFATDTQLGTGQTASSKVTFDTDINVDIDTLTLWLSVELNPDVDLSHRINASVVKVVTSIGNVDVSTLEQTEGLRVGVALRQHMQDNVNTSRIPGLTTSKKGTLLAIYDARHDSEDDLQGDMDIALNRSSDGGRTWTPMQVVIDMGTWGGLPEKYNGVSDACILSDDNTGDLYIIGLWMHGVLDSKTGRWVENLSDTSTVWNHQWRSFGSQPGYHVKRSSQFMIVKSTDDGMTWSKPINLTSQVKKEEWWLLAPAPGHGITLTDGTLVFPTEGRDKTGLQFSTITWSKDSGKTWTTGTAAYTNTNECMAAELSDGSIMLNMRERSNRGRMEGNGRAIAVTKDLGRTWSEHHTSRNALIESACMASIHRHNYTENGEKKSVLFFFNPSSKTTRNNFTLKTSFDDGNSWDESFWLLLDEFKGSGYSCITSVDENTIGIVYEGSQADLVYQQIKISEILNKRTNETK